MQKINDEYVTKYGILIGFSVTDGVQIAAIIQEMNHGKDTKYNVLTVFRMTPI